MIWLCPQGVAALGVLPMIFDETDPRPAREQVNDRYSHGGGFVPFEGFTLHDEGPLAARMVYREGEPTESGEAEVVREYARTQLVGPAGRETLIVFEGSWVAVVQEDGSYAVCRMD